MKLDFIVNFFKYINNLPGCVKSCIITFLLGIIFINYIEKQNMNILKQYTQNTEIAEQQAEQYTINTASDINRYISDIAEKDKDAYDVILLSYHNTQKSLQGYRYLYLNCLTEKLIGIDSEPLKDYWSNLDYIYYEDELSKIHNLEFLPISNVDDIQVTMPKFYRKLCLSGAKAAAFYTIEGLNNPIGMVVILYKEPHVNNKNVEKILFDIQKLALLLDYQNVKK